MIDLIDAEGRKENRIELTNPINDNYLTSPINDEDSIDPLVDPIDSMDDYLMDSVDEEEIMLNKEWVQALIDLDEAGYND